MILGIHILQSLDYRVIVSVRESAVRAVLNAVREHFRVTRAVFQVVQRAVAEQAVEVLGVGYFMAREIFTVRVTEEARAVHRRSPPFCPHE